MDYYYGIFDKLYQEHDIHKRLTKCPQATFNRPTKLLMERSLQDSRPTNILNEADANWKQTYPTKWFTSFFRAQLPSQYTEQVLGTTFSLWSARHIQRSIKRIRKKTMSNMWRQIQCCGLNIHVATNSYTRLVTDHNG